MRSIESFNVIAVLNLFFFGFLEVFLVFDQKYQNPRENKIAKKNFVFFGFLKKNKIADPNSPACTYMGLAILFFLFFVGFLEVFLVFDQKYQKPRENQKNKKNKIADPNSPACTYMGLAILVFLFFFCFFGFLEVFFGFWPKVSKTSRKPKKTKKKTKIADPNSPACTYMGLAILFFFVFSRFFWVFDQKYQKPRQNQKNKIADPNSPACTYMGLAILALFAFLHDVRPCARWWLQFIKECSNCIKMTVLAHCHGSPFWK